MELISMPSSITVGMLPPQYRFNLHTGPRAAQIACPVCNGLTRPRVLPLAIYVDADRTVSVETICRYCRECDLVTAYRDDIDSGLAAHFLVVDPSVIGAPYMILGTFDEVAMSLRRGQPIELQETIDYLHDFREVLVPITSAKREYAAV
jgi:hypothetical protein